MTDKALKQKIKELVYRGKDGLHPVYSGKKGTFAIAQYSNLTEIIPVKKTGMTGRFRWGYEDDKLIRQIKKTGSFKDELKYAKKLIS